MCPPTHDEDKHPAHDRPAYSRSKGPADSKPMAKAWSVGVYDAHCHPTDVVASIDRIPDMKARVLTVMSTRSQDQELVKKAAEKLAIESRDDVDAEGASAKTKKVIPAFGWHPWFSHQIYDDRDGVETMSIDPVTHFRNVLVPSPDDEEFLRGLQKPRPLSVFLQETEARLQQFPLALIGEIGLDRGFRLPAGPSPMTGDGSAKPEKKNTIYTPGTREGRSLTPYKVNMEHQKLVLKAQLELAAKYRRAVSVHSVQAHGAVFEVLQSMWKGHERPSKTQLKKMKKDAANAVDPTADDTTRDDGALPYPPRICMHSYSGPADALRQFLEHKVPADIFFSFSECINFGEPVSSKIEGVIKAVPEDRILVESDLNCAGTYMDDSLEKIVRRVCNIKGWELEEGTKILKTNWLRFIFGE